MDEKELYDKFDALNSQINAIETEKKQIAWVHGVPTIIEKMKRLGKDVIYLREADNQGIFCTEELWFFYGNGRFAARTLELEDDKLFVVYNTIWNKEESYESNWEYGDDDMKAEVDETIAGELIVEILPALLASDEVFSVNEEEDEIEQEEECEEEEEHFEEPSLEEIINQKIILNSGSNNISGAIKIKPLLLKYRYRRMMRPR